MNTDEHRLKMAFETCPKPLSKRLLLSVFICVHLWTFLLLSCGSKPTDPRTVIPADALVYLETADLGRALEAITSNQKFIELAKSKPDLSGLSGIRMSVAVTGFQTTEDSVTEENAVLNFKPRFVAVAETNAWNYQALSFAENKLGEFVNDIYDGEVELVTSDKHGGKYFIWTGNDGRKAYALVRGSLILFGNDESAIDNCVNVMNGGAENIAKNVKVSAFAQDSLASGYVSKDGVAQIANVAGVSLAVEAGEESEVKSFVARVVPEIVRNSVTEVTWTAHRGDNGGMEDSYTLSLDQETARVLGETIVPGTAAEPQLNRFRFQEFVSTTRYSLKDVQIAWRSALLTARTKTDQVSGNLLAAFSSTLFESYAIEEPEIFLSSVSGQLQTVRFDVDGNEVALIAQVTNRQKLAGALAKELNIGRPSTAAGTKSQSNFEESWRSEGGELSAAIDANTIIIGDSDAVTKCISAYKNDGEPNSEGDPFRGSNAAIATTGVDTDLEARLIQVISDRKNDNAPLNQTYLTETRFNQSGMERLTVSDFGLIGAIIAQLDK